MTHEGFNTLLDVISHRAESLPFKTAFTYNNVPCSFDELWKNIKRFCTFLQQTGIKKKECILIALPNSSEFFFAFYGVQLAGGIAVPIYPKSGVERIMSFARLCEANLIVMPSDAEKKAAGSTPDLRFITVSEGLSHSDDFALSPIHPDDVAFIQYTSGSTGSPKGVMLTHANLLNNIRQMIEGMEITEKEIFVSWLPVYHDMGLILKTMVPFYLGAQTHLLPTDLRGVHPWLKMIMEKKATFTAAPDFAYRLLTRHVKQGEYDLSSLRVALNAAEPVRAATIEAFESLFRLKNVMVAGYGLAEATVGVSMWKPNTANQVDAQNRVSVGKPFPDVEALIVQGDNILPSNEIGEIAIRSISNSSGYYNNPLETENLQWKNGYILSGDLGCLDRNGYLYIVGRKKNIIKHMGTTIAPQEIEELIDSISNVRFSAAVGIDKDGLEGEQVYVFAELRNQGLSPDNLNEVTIRIVDDFHERMGFRPARILLLKSHSIPLTHNGKIQYGILKETYLNGTLRQQGLILYPEY